MTKTTQKITVIGAGINGLVAANYLARAGHQVTLVEGQSYFDRQYAPDANRRFYQFGEFENLSICGSSTYPCGSVTGTPGYRCLSELQRKFGK
jgi:phytoene dehydrogenase-like protein